MRAPHQLSGSESPVSTRGLERPNTPKKYVIKFNETRFFYL